MQTFHRIGIGVLIGLSFATGYALRANHIVREEAVATMRSPSLAPGTRIAAAELQGAANVDFRPIQTLYLVLTSLREHYVEQINGKDQSEMTYGAIESMLASLNDPDTKFVKPDERKVIGDAQEGKFHGIGAMLSIKRATKDGFNEEMLEVVSPVSGGPADEAGLRAGDVIVSVNGKTVLPFDPFQRVTKVIKDGRNAKTARSELKKQLETEQKRIENGTSIMEAEKLLTMEDKEKLDLMVLKSGSSKPAKVTVQPRQFTATPVTSKMLENGDYGYVKINCFCKQTAELFGNAIGEIKSRGAKGLVLDLRNLSGGETESVVEVAKYLAPERSLGVLVKSRERKGTIRIPRVVGNDPWRDPMVVLVNHGTARTPEVLAASLQENSVAKLVGETTYGDSAYTTLFDQKDGSAVFMSTGKFLTSKGRDFSGKGIQVDVKVASGTKGDPQLNEAVKLLASAKREG